MHVLQSAVYATSSKVLNSSTIYSTTCNAMQDQQGRMKMVTYFTGMCSTFLRDMSVNADEAGLDRMHRQFGLESVQFHQALPIYAYKLDFLGKLQQQQCVVLKSAAGSGNHATACYIASANCALYSINHMSAHKMLSIDRKCAIHTFRMKAGMLRMWQVQCRLSSMYSDAIALHH